MPSQEGSNLRPSWPFRRTLNKQKVRYGEWSTKKMLVYDVRSWNVYENKQNYDTLSHEKSDICVELTRILQKIVGLKGQFGVSSICGVALARNFTIIIGLRAASIQETPHPLRTSAPSPLGEGWLLNCPLQGERAAAMRRRVRGHFASNKPLGCGSASLRCTVKHLIAQPMNWGRTHDSIGKSPDR